MIRKVPMWIIDRLLNDAADSMRWSILAGIDEFARTQAGARYISAWGLAGCPDWPSSDQWVAWLERACRGSWDGVEENSK